MSAIAVHVVEGEPRVSSRDVAARLDVDHRHTYEMILDYRADFEALGKLRFETAEIKGRGQPAKYLMLNEDQAYLLLTYARNTPAARACKLALVQAFRQARERLAGPQPPALPSSPLELLELSLRALKEQDRRVAALEAATRQLADDRAALPIGLFPRQKGALHRALQKLGRLEGNYSRVYRDFHERYGLASYADLPRNRYEEALAYVNGRIAACQAGGALLEEA